MTDEIGQEPEAKPEWRDAKGRFQPGNRFNPNGRPKGSRDALAYDFVAALQNEFLKRGTQAISDLDSPTLCTMITKVLPKENVVDLGQNFADLLTRAADVLANRGK